jgi:hypothetical protein
LNRVVLGHVHASDFCELQKLAFHHFLGQVDEHIENAKVAFFERHLERLHVQPVPCQDAAMVAPARVRGRTAAARVGAVDHIVVNQRGAVQEFDYGGELDCTRAAVTRVACGQKQERGAKAFATTTQEIGGDFGNRLEGGGALSRQFVFHEDEIISDEIENLPGCEQRDGLPPGLHERRCACEAHSILCDRAAVNLFKVDSKPNYLACALSTLGKAPSRPTSS